MGAALLRNLGGLITEPERELYAGVLWRRDPRRFDRTHMNRLVDWSECLWEHRNNRRAAPPAPGQNLLVRRPDEGDPDFGAYADGGDPERD